MARGIVRTAAAPSSPFYSQGVIAGGLLHVSGMVGIDPGTGELAGPTIADQTRQALANCLAIASSCGASSDDVVEVGVLLAEPADFAAFNEEWSHRFGTDPPARYVAKLGVDLPGVLVSIRMVVSVTAGADQV
jgi:2-iminobutanoate/2-iminopropanoate deaminase